tara:strand:- start:366 stop:758 length:393 start_codon:yes stop_codon:yes gene_type:complete
MVGHMSQPKYCQGPICHEHKTKDRIRGPKGDKHYETRRRSHMYYGDEWCSMQCYNDWLNEYGTRAVDHFGRTTEAKRTGCDAAWYKDYDYSYSSNGSSRTNHRFVNDLLGERRPITAEQYNDENLTTPTS